MSRLAEKMKEAATNVAAQEKATAANRAATHAAAIARRPRLTAATIFQSLDWVLDHHELLGPSANLHMQAIELGIRTMTTEAQGKATQHTLVDEGKMAAPPAS